MAYAEAFEVGFATSDWNVVGDHLADDITWILDGLPAPVGGTNIGREAVLEGIRLSVDSFDRRFDLRKPEATCPPAAFADGVYLPWQITYTRSDLPPFVLIGEEWDIFRDGKMVLHYERIGNTKEMAAYLNHYDALLLPV
jgi:hypothetical protein